MKYISRYGSGKMGMSCCELVLNWNLKLTSFVSSLNNLSSRRKHCVDIKFPVYCDTVYDFERSNEGLKFKALRFIFKLA